ncbi:MAG: PilC/PilY family type IV pilus protein [Methylovulum sp.]|uniref:pilus assembly protein n=1 Tax=Methylovulum sp. TaxID=1916980 RepID=UPI002601ECAF|nr:PilC/PilY family type IV pilus protein [Methylovulum sp.]MDD2724763.1 PilC/PilY family type IV pilus protein [Methylovulum sp.]
MNTFKHKPYLSPNSLLVWLALGLMAWLPASTSLAAIAPAPLFLSTSVPPIVMLVMGRNHKLYYEAYNDASDLNNDGLIDVGYKPGIDYYGYFDSHKCYIYDLNKFTPTSITTDKSCTSEWSGDFLNYLTTSRMDAIRKVLYGGQRSTDTTGSTVLKRVFIPQDAHSWGKEYTSVAVDGYDIRDYTPLPLPASGKRHLFASTTLTGSASDPLLRVLPNSTYRIWEWVSIERPVAGPKCLHGSSGPACGTITDYRVYVDVCLPSLLETNCKAYSDGTTTTYKPTGLLHIYGEEDLVYFGLLTGSYKKNISGGVLRKNIQSFKNEVNPTTGQFLAVKGIVDTINKLRVVTFNYACPYCYASGWIATRPINEGEAAEWGEPVAEMMYEGLRYFAGKASPTPAFSISSTDTPDATLGLPVATWLDPYKAVAAGGGGHLSCARPMELVISDINPSYDTDQLPGSYFNVFASDLAGLNVSTLADSIWAGETEASNIFIGQSNTHSDGTPSPKTVTSFKDIRGLAPEEPTKLGGYYAASVAMHGRGSDLHTAAGNQKTDTIAVALASPLPRIEIPVDGKKITLVPFAKSVGGAFGISNSEGQFQPTNQIVDFYVEKIANTATGNMDGSINQGRPYGKFRINYEDVEQAADHDMDAIVEYTFTVNASKQVVVDLNSTYAAGGIIQHMGYVISGTESSDGVYLEVRDKDTAVGSDPDYFLDTPPGSAPWNDGQPLPLTASRTFTAGANTSASFIKHDPLWYAAKWGTTDKNDDGVIDALDWDSDEDGVPDNYFLVTNAGKLPEQLGKAFAKALNVVGSASAVAANSTRLDKGTQVYQAKFNSKYWNGQLFAYNIDPDTGALTIDWEASSKLPLPVTASRKIYTYNPLAVPRSIEFKWDNLNPSQQTYLDTLVGFNDGNGSLRVDWLRGDNAKEQKYTGGIFRDRLYSALGDIVNSDPVFVGKEDYGYAGLPGVEGSSYEAFLTTNKTRKPMIYVGGNDGMLHGFDATNATGGTEILAYIPNALFPELSKLTSPNYAHQYYVDGQSAVSDVYYGSDWHTVLAGTTGAGGRAVFALDVTDPDHFGSVGGPLWEFTNADDGDLGYTLAQPTVVKMQDGHWAVIVANGYNSDSGHAVLFVLDVETGAVLQKIDTGIGDPTNKNGLSSPVAVDANLDRSVDTVYAGDLYGNLWKFNLADAAGTWPVPSAPFFVACTTAGGCSAPNDPNRQPITGKPNVGAVGAVGTDQNGVGIMVYFGTGKYFETGDNIVSASPPPPVQTFYGLWDKGTSITDRGLLKEQTIDAEGTFGTAHPLRVVSKDPVCYKAPCPSGPVRSGWALDLKSPVNGPEGERVVSFPLVRRGLVIFPTVIPDRDPCSSGGKSWLMELDALNGGEFSGAPFDTNGDGKVDNDDLVTVNGEKHAASGIDLGVGIIKTPAVVEAPIVDYKYVSGSDGTMGSVADVKPPAGPGIRRSWRQLR